MGVRAFDTLSPIHLDISLKNPLDMSLRISLPIIPVQIRTVQQGRDLIISSYNKKAKPFKARKQKEELNMYSEIKVLKFPKRKLPKLEPKVYASKSDRTRIKRGFKDCMKHLREMNKDIETKYSIKEDDFKTKNEISVYDQPVFGCVYKKPKEYQPSQRDPCKFSLAQNHKIYEDMIAKQKQAMKHDYIPKFQIKDK